MLLRCVSNLKGIDKNDEVLLTCHIRVKKTQKKKKVGLVGLWKRRVGE